MKNRHDPAELLRYSGEHLMHEISMLWESADKLRSHPKGTTEYIALLESFATHLRNLIEFLFDKPKDDYVRARHFFEDPAQWKHTTRPREWQTLYKRASQEVNHLTIGRIDGEPPPKTWEIGKILTQFEPLLREFAKTASPRRLNPAIRELFQQPPDKILDWIAGRVRHSNIAVPAPVAFTSLSHVSASTATVTISVLDPTQPWPK